MERKLQIFISSTYTDLIEERQEAVEAILNAGHIPAGMELFKAGNQTQKEIIEEWIKESDVYLLILGARYGTIDTDLDISYTEWEYNLAGELGIPRFSLVLSDEFIDDKVNQKKLKIADIERNSEKFKKFRANVESQIVSFIDHSKAIKGEILGSLNDIERKYKSLKGWVRYSEKYDEKEYYKLIQENQKLREQLLDNKIKLREETKDLKQGDDLINIKINYDVYEKSLYVTKTTQKEYMRFAFKESGIFEVDCSINELLKKILPYLVEYDEQGAIKSNIQNILKQYILEKIGIVTKKVYSEDKMQYKTDFDISEIDRIITQFHLLGYISYNQEEKQNNYYNHIYICITDLGREELQKFYAYRK